MPQKKLKRIFLLCLVILVVLLFVSSYRYRDNYDERDENEPSKQVTDVNINESRKFENLNYNNLSRDEMDYVSDKYSGTAKFTSRGVEVYYESIFSGNLKKIITSTWPEDEIGNMIPNPEYGVLNRIEYSTDWISVYIKDAKKNDAKNYVDELEECGFNQSKAKDDGKVMLKYDVYNEKGDRVTVKFMKETKTLEIKAEKAK